MAKLPPKIPIIVSQGQHNNHHTQWLELNHDSLNLAQHPHPHQPWVDEFMEFSAAKRNAHRRTVSDSSVAFIEAGPVPFLAPFRCPDTSNGLKKSDDHFDKFDDEQFMSMFSNDIGGSSSNPSSTSDHNSTNEDQKRKGGAAHAEGRGGIRDGDVEVRVAAAMVKNEAEEVESSCKYDKEGQGQGQHGDVGSKDGNTNGESGDCNAGGNSEQQQVVDPKRFKRILANRQSAQRSRVRKLQYISELERSVTALQSEVSVLSPRVAFLDHQRMILNVDNSALKAKIAALAQDKIFKDAHQEALKREIERLRQVHYQQSIKNTEGMVTPPSSSPLPSTTPQPQQPDTIVNEHEQLTG